MAGVARICTYTLIEEAVREIGYNDDSYHILIYIFE